MIWQKTSDYSIKSGKYSICKVILCDKPRFEIYSDDQKTILAVFDTPEEAKQAVKEMTRNEKKQ